MRVFVTKFVLVGAMVLAGSLAFAKCEPGEKKTRFGLVKSDVETPTLRIAREVQTQFQRALNGKHCVEIVQDETVSLGNEFEALEANAVDLVAPSFSRLGVRFPRYRIFGIPFVFTDQFALMKYLAALPPSYWDRGFDALDVQPYPLAIAGMDQLGSKKNVFEPADVVGLKFQVSQGHPSREMLRLLQATGQSVVTKNVGAAVRDGRIEAQFSDWSFLLASGSADAHAALVEMNMAVHGAQVLGAGKWLRSHGPINRKALNEAIAEGIRQFNRRESQRIAEAKRKILQAGKPVYVLTRQQRAKWIDLVYPLWQPYGGTESGAEQLRAAVKAGK